MKQQKEDRRSQKDLPNPVAPTSMNMPDFLSSESPFSCPESRNMPLSVHDNIVYKFYKLHGSAGVELACKKGTDMPTFRRL